MIPLIFPVRFPNLPCHGLLTFPTPGTPTPGPLRTPPGPEKEPYKLVRKSRGWDVFFFIARYDDLYEGYELTFSLRCFWAFFSGAGPKKNTNSTFPWAVGWWPQLGDVQVEDVLKTQIYNVYAKLTYIPNTNPAPEIIKPCFFSNKAILRDIVLADTAL